MDASMIEMRNVLERISAVHIGIDLGQLQDPSAVVVVEVGQRATDRTFVQNGQKWNVPETTYRVQRMRRLDLGTSYVKVAAEVAKLIRGLWKWEVDLRKKGALQPYEPALPWDIWADATGVGLPVMEMLDERLQASPETDRVRLHPVKFYHGDVFRRGALDDGRADALGKAYLVSKLQVLFQEDRLRLPPDDKEALAMMRELKDYEIKVDENANDKYGAFKVGTHDDLVTALGLACIEDPGFYGVEEGPRIW